MEKTVKLSKIVKSDHSYQAAEENEISTPNAPKKETEPHAKLCDLKKEPKPVGTAEPSIFASEITESRSSTWQTETGEPSVFEVVITEAGQVKYATTTEASSTFKFSVRDNQGGSEHSEQLQGLSELSEKLSSCPDVTASLISTKASTAFLRVLPSKMDDDFLLDQAAVFIKIRHQNVSGLVAELYTHNRQILERKIIDFTSDLDFVEEWLVRRNYHYCQGLSVTEAEMEDGGRLNTRIMSSILVEMYNSQIYYRSRRCRFVLQQAGQTTEIGDKLTYMATQEGKTSSAWSTSCGECRSLLNQLRGNAHIDFGANSVSAKVTGVNDDSQNLITTVISEEEDDAGYALDNEPMGQPEDVPTQGKLPRRRYRKPKLEIPSTESEQLDVEESSPDKEAKQPPSYICTQVNCIRKFKTTEALQIHERKHLGLKPYVCNLCGKEIGNRQNYVLHLKSHAGDKAYACEVCDKKFVRRAAMMVHFRSVHQNDRSFLCYDCGSCFKVRTALIDHRKRIHQQVKMFSCNFCDKSFFSKKDWIEHSRTHTGERPFQCPQCGKCFPRNAHLKRHIKTVHKAMNKQTEPDADDPLAVATSAVSQTEFSEIKSLPTFERGLNPQSVHHIPKRNVPAAGDVGGAPGMGDAGMKLNQHMVPLMGVKGQNSVLISRLQAPIEVSLPTSQTQLHPLLHQAPNMRTSQVAVCQSTSVITSRYSGKVSSNVSMARASGTATGLTAVQSSVASTASSMAASIHNASTDMPVNFTNTVLRHGHNLTGPPQDSPGGHVSMMQAGGQLTGSGNLRIAEPGIVIPNKNQVILVPKALAPQPTSVTAVRDGKVVEMKGDGDDWFVVVQPNFPPS